MAYSHRAVLYSNIQSLTKLIEGGKHATELRLNPTLRQQRMIHFFDKHTLEECKARLEKLKEQNLKLLE